MTTHEFEEIKDSLLAKRYKGVRLKPAEEGFNDGMYRAISVLETMIGKNYENAKNALLRERPRSALSNREAGFEDAILRAASKLREIHQRSAGTRKESPKNVKFTDVEHILFDDLGNPRRAFEIQIYDKNSLGEWNQVETVCTNGSIFYAVPDANGTLVPYHRCNDTLLPLNTDFNSPSCGRCYVVGKEIPVVHKVVGNEVLSRTQSRSGQIYELRRQDYSDSPSFYYFADASGRFRVNHGNHDLHALLDRLKRDFSSDRGLGHHLDQLSLCMPDKVVSMEFHKWVRFENLVGEHITYDEFKTLDSLCGLDVLEVQPKDLAFVQVFQTNLQSIRTGADELVYVTPCVKVEWVNLDEGWNGDYNTNDPTDENLLRFDVSVLRDGKWEEKDDASYCTQFPATASLEDKCNALRILGREYDDALSSDIDVSVKKLGERLSYISPASLSRSVAPHPPLSDQIKGAQAKADVTRNTDRTSITQTFANER